MLPRKKAVDYPRCIDGGMACPPEDCGGPPGYEHLLEILANPGHDEHEETRVWAGEFNAKRFDSRHVDFEDPGERWRVAILGEEDGFW